MKYDVFDTMDGEFTDEDAKVVMEARKEFDKHYQVYKAELEIASKILKEALYPPEEGNIKLD